LHPSILKPLAQLGYKRIIGRGVRNEDRRHQAHLNCRGLLQDQTKAAHNLWPLLRIDYRMGSARGGRQCATTGTAVRRHHEDPPLELRYCVPLLVRHMSSGFNSRHPRSLIR
jgi:hypothetical protein